MSVLLAAIAGLSLSPGPLIAYTPVQRYERQNHREFGRRRGSVRTFDAPELDGYPLDICPSDVGVDGLVRGRCGMTVANDYCRARGFAEATDAPHEGGQGTTIQLTGALVTHPWATTFRYITCVR
ncbi:hypothetical protein GCM10009424_01090 [Sphingomonas ursincola]|uniref:Uncharacterized protein n=1 Tax=Sphingomonas ursincola TaxID=56361 RepID=A0A7V8UAE6_9SPHN|nr:hypothetical protein [Sphingomonas ursincola]MBA1375893.1 hypothetical protein [Sphingomonas ursincola]